MIQFSLKCDRDHRFDSWFKSASACDTLVQAGHVKCPVCGSEAVSKAIMAPRVSTGRKSARPDPDAASPASKGKAPALLEPQSDVEKAISALRKKVEATSDYVGKDFVREARAMHAGEKPERSIYGEARLDQARALAEEGIRMMPLPFRPKRSIQ